MNLNTSIYPGDESKSINFDVYIYEDALSLLLNDKVDVRAEILGQLQQGDPCLEEVGRQLHDICEELVLDTEKIVGRFEELSCEEIMKYISFSETGISFDYEESVACGNRRMCAFRVACTFDTDRYLKEVAVTDWVEISPDLETVEALMNAFLEGKETLANEIEDVKGTISNERLWEKGASTDEERLMHAMNIATQTEYLSRLKRIGGMA